MTEPVPAPLPEPTPDHPDDEKIPESWVAGARQFREAVEGFKKWVLRGAIALGVAFATIGIVAVVALRHSDQNTQRLKERAISRDRIQAQTDERLDRQAVEIAEIQRKGQMAVCTLVLGSLQQDKNKGTPANPLTVQFGRDYGCPIPGLTAVPSSGG